MHRGKSVPKKENPSKKNGDDSRGGSAGDMHYASASKARERDRAIASRGVRRGIFGKCLSSRIRKLLFLIALGFAVYAFLASNGYLKSEREDTIDPDFARMQMIQKVQNQDIKPRQQVEKLDNGLEDEDLSNSREGEGDDEAEEEENIGQDEEEEGEEDGEDEEPAPNYDHIYKYHVLQTLTNTEKMPHLKTRFEVCMRSILDKASVDLLFFFVVDEPSKKYLEMVLQHFTNERIAKSKFQFIFLDIDELAHELAPLVELMQAHISSGHPYYKDSIFFLSTMLHEGLLPEYVHRVIMLDTDLKFMTDIKQLFNHFDHFTGDNIMGIVHEQQPVYRHMFSLYRSQNRGTRVGDPPPNGLTGFNSGVLLLDLDRMRVSESYKRYLQPEVVKEVRDKYHFKGHLGDQDFYSLISMEKEDLFYNIPCSWNKQLCQWWKDKGYQNVWDQYFVCNEKINVYHGNCNTPIPY